MLTKKEFIIQINSLRDFKRKLDEFYFDMQKYFDGPQFQLGYDLFDNNVTLLCELMGERSTEWICWFIYDTEFNKKKQSVKINGKEVKITSNNLYKILIEENK